MQIVSDSPPNFYFHIHRTTLAVQEEFSVASTDLASPIAYFFRVISSEIPVPCFLSSVFYYVMSNTSSHIHLRAHVLPISYYNHPSVECSKLIGAGFEN